MGILRPLPMVKVGVLGLKDDREVLLSTLHDLGVVQVEPAGKATLELLEPERTSELQRTVSDQLTRFRGLKTALPPTPAPAGRAFPTLESVLAAGREVPIDDEVGSLKREEDKLLTERVQLTETLDLLARFGFYRDRLDYLNAKSLLSFFGEAPSATFRTLQAEVPGLSTAAQFLSAPVGESTLFVLAVPTAQAEAVGHLAQQKGIKLYPVPRLAGTPAEEAPVLEGKRAALDQRVAQIRARLAEIAQQWYGTVLHVEEALAIENRKFEIYPKLAAGRSSFAVEGWVPTRERPRLESTLQAVTRGRVHLYEIPTAEEPPTFMENPPGIRWYEFFIRFYSLPQATEWDPTFIFAIVFPILFGLMLGDVGYASVILGFCLWMIAGFPGGRHLPKALTGFLTNIMGASSMRKLAFALVPGTIVGIVVGVLSDAYFGFSLPYTPVFTPLSNTGQLLLIAGYLGLTMVLLGLVLGVLKEYFHHQYKHAAGKVGTILSAIGLVGIGLGLLRSQLDFSSFGLTFVYLGLLIGGLIIMLVSVGIMEMGMGFIDVLSHILSYTRLVGILLASVILAEVVNGITVGANSRSGLIFSGAVGYAVLGIVLLLVVQVFNVVLGVFEPGIQGARLIFVEHFSKYYTGNGRAFHPFSSDRTVTQSAHVPARSP